MARQRQQHGQAVSAGQFEWCGALCTRRFCSSRAVLSCAFCSTARKVFANDFQRAMAELRANYLRANEDAQNESISALDSDKIHVYVRKRPLLPHELAKQEFDVISSIGQREIVIHECKMYSGREREHPVGLNGSCCTNAAATYS